MVPLLMQNGVLANIPGPVPDGDSMAAALGRVLRWPGLHASERQKRLLIYLVEETLAGRSNRLKAYNIATTILGRNERFDPQIDPVVRIEVSQLRRCLERYYLIEGQAEQHRIVIPRGSYAPRLEPASPPADLRPQAGPAVQRSRVRRYGIPVMAGLGALLLAAMSLALIRPACDDRLTTGDLTFRPSIRIDGFANASTDPALDGFAHVVTSESTSALVPFKSLHIYVSGGTPPDRDRIDYRLQGSVNRLSNEIRVTAQLVDAASRTVLWARDYAAPPGGPSAGAEIARRIAAVLGDPYGPLFSLEAKTADRVVRNSPTVRTCMLAFYAYVETWAPDLHRRLRDCHEAVVRGLPNESEAWAHLSFLYLDEFKYGYNPLIGAAPPLQRAEEAARRAVASDPTDAWAHVALALIGWFNHDLTSFSVEAERALTLNPNDPLVAGEMGTRLFLHGDYDRGLALVQGVLLHGTGRPERYRDITTLNAYLHGDYTAALDEAIKGDIERRPLARLIMAAVYGKLGRRQDAERVWKALRQDLPKAVAAPRAILLDREWAPEIVDALMSGLYEAGVVEWHVGENAALATVKSPPP